MTLATADGQRSCSRFTTSKEDYDQLKAPLLAWAVRREVFDELSERFLLLL